MEEDVVWLLHKGIVCVVDKVVESPKLSLGIRHIKTACVDAGVEGGN